MGDQRTDFIVNALQKKDAEEDEDPQMLLF